MSGFTFPEPHIEKLISDQPLRWGIIGPGESYHDLLADASGYESFDEDSYFAAKGFSFVKLNQLATERLMGVR
jgi:xylose isomerase